MQKPHVKEKKHHNPVVEEGKGDLLVGEKTTVEQISQFLIRRYDLKQDTRVFLSRKN